MWGQYPALLDVQEPSSGPASVIEGAAYRVQTVKDGARLAEYETGSYRAKACVIRYTDGQEPKEEMGHAFKFVGDEREISEGEFDMRVWLRMMGRRGAVERLDEKRVGGTGTGSG